MADELDAPLRRRGARKPERPLWVGKRHWPVGRLLALLLVVVVGAVGLRIALVDEPMGGRPAAEVAVGTPTTSAPAPSPTPATITADPEQSIESLAVAPTAPGQGAASGIDATDLALADRMVDARGVYADLVEETDKGPLPRMSAGRTPFDAYRRASVTPGDSGGRALVALVVTGLGLNEAGTLDAISRLPDEVSLAFAPYGRALGRTSEAARADGHELFLEVPMEPFDYPENDPGPDTLLTGQGARQTIDKLYTVMASFGGYAGVINNMGARFTASAADFGPAMEELGTRGLGYIDDGSSNRSLAPQLAAGNRVPFARAVTTLDSDPSRAAVLAALSSLEDSAKANGQALGIFSALPVSIAAVTEWAAGLEARGLLLVPASALMK
jgi:polysaccharide deacetylase 2 family uncharacterized protein YibQ